jgi:hypothetical protein
MEMEERLKALEDEFSQTKNETKQIMMDIRALLMEAGSPLRSQIPSGRTSDQNESIKG